MLKYGLPMAPAPVVVVMVAEVVVVDVVPALVSGMAFLSSASSQACCSAEKLPDRSGCRTCKMACLAACQGRLVPGSCMRMLLSIDTHAQISRAFHLLTLFKAMP